MLCPRILGRRKPLVEALPTVAHYLLRRAIRQTTHRARPERPRPGGTLALTGDAASLRFLIDEATGTAIVHDPHANTLTVAAVVSHPAYVLLSPQEQAHRVHAWGRVLAGLASARAGTRVQVMEISLPDAGRGITGWWESNGKWDRDQWAVRPAAVSVEHAALDAALNFAASTCTTPTLPGVVDALLAPRTALPGATIVELARDGRDLGHGLRRLVAGGLAGLFDGPSTIRFDPSLPMVTLDLSRIQGSDQLIAMVMTCASAWMESVLASSDGGQRWVIYDEAWRLMRQPALLARMQSQWKLSRGLDIANLLIIHRLSDLDSVGDVGSESRALARGLLGDCSTKIIYQQEVSESAQTARELGLTSVEHDQLPDLQQGEGLWRVGQRSFVVRHLRPQKSQPSSTPTPEWSFKHIRVHPGSGMRASSSW